VIQVTDDESAAGGHGTGAGHGACRAHSHSQHPGEVVIDEAFWEERYRSRSAVWSGNPNAHLVNEASGLVPGAALDVGCGEGADAIWLAERGWQVSAVDFSATALERGAARARNVGSEVARRVEWLHRDLMEWVPPKAYYDLVSAQFMQLPSAQRESVFPRLAAAVAPGGSLLIVGHHPSDLQTTAPRPPMAELFYSASDVVDSLDARVWEILTSATRERSSTDPDGRPITIHDTVVRAQRRE
jgi:SAM-dependent methyltransferase